MQDKKLDTGKSKIEKICDLLKKETVDPAKQEAQEIVENAHLQSQEIIKKAKEDSEKIIAEAKRQGEEHKKVFEASLNLSCKQALDLLKQSVEKELFDARLSEVITKETSDGETVSEMIKRFVSMAVEKGLDADLSVLVPKAFKAKDLNKLLLQETLEKLRNQTVEIGEFQGGVKLKLHDMQITLDITDEALKELVARYIRKDFREIVFKS
ncbi:MAG: V-type ATP synthase subunit E [Chlamydiae bacterium CG10_big_fil_rev_8_21_14_0_10_35_9]|nr:MAG: V-type ATP synthase subunit E [Chlamydiae bacterium CG10_big_fil_rev_8_21_14_0_10_35_9]